MLEDAGKTLRFDTTSVLKFVIAFIPLFITVFMDRDDFDEIREHIEKNGIQDIEGLLKNKLERWRDFEVNIGITGDSGTGKSSFINAIRGLHDDDVGAAEVQVTGCTKEPTTYDHPANPKIKFWDLPGIGTPNYPAETYCEQVELERYNMFLIFAGRRFTEYNLKLAKKIRSIGKKFFFVRTKLDEHRAAEKRKRSFNEDVMLDEVRSYCSESLGELLSSKEDIFLISNHYPAKWDFPRLAKAIIDVLPTIQRESLTSSLTSFSTKILKRKVEVLRGRIHKVALASAAAAAIPIPGLSLATDAALLLREIRFYRSQLAFPEEGSTEFLKLQFFTQKQILLRCLTTTAQFGTLLVPYALRSIIKGGDRFVQFIGSAIAGGLSFAAAYAALNQCLKDLEETALIVLQDVSQKSLEETD